MNLQTGMLERTLAHSSCYAFCCFSSINYLIWFSFFSVANLASSGFLKVDWEDERECFQTISAAIANFYAMHPPILPNPSGSGIQFYKKTKDQTSYDLTTSGMLFFSCPFIPTPGKWDSFVYPLEFIQLPIVI